MKRRTFFSALAGLSLVLLVLAGTSFSAILANSPLSLLQKGGVMADPQGAIFIPRQAPAMVSLLVSPERLEGLRQLEARPGERRNTRVEIEKIKDSLLANTGLNYENDVQPWLGDEITFAVTDLDFDRNSNNGLQPGYLLVGKIKDGELAREFLQLYFSQSAIAGTTDLVFENYKGVNLIYKRPLLPTKNDTSLASAVVGNDFILFANSPKVLKSALNNVQVADLNLQNAPAYQNALQAITTPRIGVGFVNLPTVAAWINNQPIPEDAAWEQLLTLTLTVNRAGLVADTALAGITADVANRQPALSEPVSALQYSPGTSSLAAAGVNLNGFWEGFSERLAEDNPIQLLLNSTLANIQNQFGIDLPQDIFSWVKGEYALSMLPHGEDNQLDWVFVAEKTTDTDAAIEHLDDLAKASGYSVGILPLGETPITAWTKLVTVAGDKQYKRLNAQVRGIHTEVNNYEIFATSLAAMDEALTGNNLLKNKQFQKSIAPFPKENDGYLYIDWNESQPILQENLPVFQVVELAGKPLFEHLRSLTLSSEGSENGVRRATIFFNLN